MKIKYLLGLLLLGTLMLSSCSNDNEVTGIKPGQEKYIAAFTSGTIPRTASIVVRFTDTLLAQPTIDKLIKEEAISVKPEIEFSMKWVDGNALFLNPHNPLPSGEKFTVNVDLEVFFPGIDPDIENFAFSFATKAQSFEIDIIKSGSISDTEIRYHRLEGNLEFEDFVESELAHSILSAKYVGEQKNIKWLKSDDNQSYTFIIDSLERADKERTLTLKYNGESVGIEDEGEIEYNISSLNNFEFMSARIINDPDQYVILNFSDPLKQNQNLDGIVEIQGLNLTYTIDGSQLLLYPRKKQIGSYTVRIGSAIQNIIGKSLSQDTSIDIVFQDILPQIKMEEARVITPMSDKGIPIVFKAVNLKAIDLQVLKIYDDNVLQFLQANSSLDGSRYLSRVGKVIKEVKIELDNQNDLNLKEWNKHAIDLSPLVNAEPGAIYRINLRFRKSYSLYQCDEVKDDEDEQIEPVFTTKPDTGLWAYYNNYKYRSGQKNEPCYDYYYIRQRGFSRNVLASNIGLQVKELSDKKLLITATDLASAKPISNAQINIFDYQQQLIKSLKTNVEGMAKVNLESKAFVIEGKYSGMSTYLNLHHNPLDYSRFDISGKHLTKGIDAKFYTERGVWRPGDSIYAALAIRNGEQKIPDGLPVQFTFTNARGKELETRKVIYNGQSIIPFKTATRADAVTGNYRLKANIGGLQYYKNLRIETIVPNRLNLDLKFENEFIKLDDQKLGDLEVNWLHRAPAGDLKTRIRAVFTPANMSFEGYSNFEFDNPLNEFNSESKVVFEDRLDENGRADIPVQFEIDQKPGGKLNVNLNVKAFEPGGNFSNRNFSTELYTHNNFIGFTRPEGVGRYNILLNDKKHSFKIANLNTDGETVPAKNVKITVHKMSWRWWWDYYGNSGSYRHSNISEPVIQEIIDLPKGEGNWEMKLPGNSWGRYYVKICNQDGHCSGRIVYFDNANWRNREVKNQETQNVLTLVSDKENYEVGQTANIQIPSPQVGKIFLSVEQDNKVLKTEWLNGKEGGITYNLRLTEEMSPNIYVYVSLIQPHSQNTNDKPLRMYGILPISVENPKNKLKLTVEMHEVIRPESQIQVKVSEENQQAMTYTIAMVDEGLLDLTNFQTPDLYDYFYSKRSLGVKTYDVFDMVAANRMKDVGSMLSIGGGMAQETQEGQGKKIERFKPMVRYFGPFKLKKGEDRIHKINIPKYIGSVRTMVIAASDDAYGSYEETTPVKAPVMVLGTLPRVLSPNESLEMPITVFTGNDNIRNVDLEVILNEKLSINGGFSRSLRFSKQGEKTVYVPIKVAEELGKGEARIIASSGGEKAKYDIEIEVRAPNNFETRKNSGLIAGNANKEVLVNYFGYESTRSAELEIGILPPLNLKEHLNYLIRYPYGCLEQTTSSTLPQLYLSEIIELDQSQKSEIRSNIKKGLDRLQSFRLANGGFTYWPGSRYYYGSYSAHPWATAYAGHLMIEAKQRSYSVDLELLKSWVNHIRSRSHTYNENDDNENTLVQAYRLYLLALANKPEYAPMNALRSNSDLGVTASSLLAAAYYLAGQTSVANNIFKGVKIEDISTDTYESTFGSQIRNMALILNVVSTMQHDKKAKNLAWKIARSLNSDSYYSTQTRAFSLMAIANYLKQSKRADASILVELNGKKKEINFKDKPLVIMQIPNKDFDHSLSIQNNSEIEVSYSVISRAIPKAGKEEGKRNVLSLDVNYYDASGTRVDERALPQSKDIVAEYIITLSDEERRLKNIALTAIYPSGWQIHNPRMSQAGFEVNSDQPTYIDVRDDRVHYFFDLYNYSYSSSRNKKVFRIALNASFAGKFYLPSVKVHSMYEEEKRAIVPGKWIEVVNDSRPIN